MAYIGDILPSQGSRKDKLQLPRVGVWHWNHYVR